MYGFGPTNYLLLIFPQTMEELQLYKSQPPANLLLSMNENMIHFDHHKQLTLPCLVFISGANGDCGTDKKLRQAQLALLGGLWLSCCLGQETCELNMGSVEDLAVARK